MKKLYLDHWVLFTSAAGKAKEGVVEDEVLTSDNVHTLVIRVAGKTEGIYYRRPDEVFMGDKRK